MAARRVNVLLNQLSGNSLPLQAQPVAAGDFFGNVPQAAPDAVFLTKVLCIVILRDRFVFFLLDCPLITASAALVSALSIIQSIVYSACEFF
jgi:hypothetical protein